MSYLVRYWHDDGTKTILCKCDDLSNAIKISETFPLYPNDVRIQITVDEDIK